MDRTDNIFTQSENQGLEISPEIQPATLKLRLAFYPLRGRASSSGVYGGGE